MEPNLGWVEAKDYSSKINDYCPSCKEAQIRAANKAKEEREKKKNEEKDRKERFRREKRRPRSFEAPY